MPSPLISGMLLSFRQPVGVLLISPASLESCQTPESVAKATLKMVVLVSDIGPDFNLKIITTRIVYNKGF